MKAGREFVTLNLSSSGRVGRWWEACATVKLDLESNAALSFISNLRNSFGIIGFG